jgi:hypothetical protein
MLNNIPFVAMLTVVATCPQLANSRLYMHRLGFCARDGAVTPLSVGKSQLAGFEVIAAVITEKVL